MLQDLRTIQLGSSWLPEHSGGLERYYYDLLQQLPAQNVTSRGLVVGSDSVASSTNNQVISFSPTSASLLNRWYKARSAIKRLIEEFKPDLVCVHFALYGFPASDLLSRHALVVHFQGPWAQETAVENGNNRSAIKYYIEKTVYRKANRLIVLSEAFKEILIKDYRIPVDKIYVVPGAIDTEKFNITLGKVEARQKLGWPTDRPILFVVRRLSRRMGLENLLIALKDVRKKFPDVLLMLAGKGNMANELAKSADEMGLKNNIRFLGFVPDDNLSMAYRAADFTVVPSTSLEGFGLITAESMATGTPVLVTPVGGLPEIIKPFNPEWITRDIGSKAISDSINSILSGTTKIPSPESCQVYANRYDWKAVTPKISAIYREAIS
ncbi:glycosyltransferase family 4 protein [Acidithiobacillus thiooxidans]|uniref:D-inositol 3-phosphate glycosyltransferase n=1 Tax=Acidithiobacillus thiooxidans ATCC 19377 TaxID=637390 RepID=A0A543Q4E7_ACITH|nr:glycosyltransferase family 4 protein [Acidithiobacillus thiooxidans]MDR7925535.1 glycosyltransferase family 4 protein [Acidithiobacillus thiooxidans]MDX5934670.1 glycosyltransferase family 4 protein [Acidithiobacillus thiooxidans]TQN51206.1 D-inositol 3-phosphate glycosyltransferase [Acidithiobacillus thiooxidans ATCC 19377]